MLAFLVEILVLQQKLSCRSKHWRCLKIYLPVMLSKYWLQCLNLHKLDFLSFFFNLTFLLSYITPTRTHFSNLILTSLIWIKLQTVQDCYLSGFIHASYQWHWLCPVLFSFRIFCSRCKWYYHDRTCQRIMGILTPSCFGESACHVAMISCNCLLKCDISWSDEILEWLSLQLTRLHVCQCVWEKIRWKFEDNLRHLAALWMTSGLN